MSNVPLYIFTNTEIKGVTHDDVKILKYASDNFRDQYLECLVQVPFDYILTFNDDYFLTGPPNYSEISRCIDVLSGTNHSQIRFVRGPNFANEKENTSLHGMSNRQPYFFSQTLTLWKRNALIRIFERVGPSGIARKGTEVQFEVLANKACEELGQTGLVYYETEKKVGAAHYECNIVPHVVSAVVDGYWNTKEYAKELRKIESDYAITLAPERYRQTLLSRIGRLLSENI
ncbi:hypothetical protein [Shewanella sp.]|jgi:hypothetical protein|uniref:hypothetical protein n=1 Tax=Shewanella sp. TaxID=50422 RepID=UPI004048B430